MLKLTTALLGLVLVVQVVSAGFFFQSPTDKIEEYLEMVVSEPDDLNENFEVASEWKKELSNDAKKNKAIIEGISTLEALHEAMKNPKCDQEMYDIIDKNAKMAGSACFDTRYDDDYLRRLEYIVRHAVKEISKVCPEKH